MDTLREALTEITEAIAAAAAATSAHMAGDFAQSGRLYAHVKVMTAIREDVQAMLTLAE